MVTNIKNFPTVENATIITFVQDGIFREFILLDTVLEIIDEVKEGHRMKEFAEMFPSLKNAISFGIDGRQFIAVDKVLEIIEKNKFKKEDEIFSTAKSANKALCKVYDALSVYNDPHHEEEEEGEEE